MNEPKKRRLVLACLIGSLSLAGCQMLNPDPPPTTTPPGSSHIYSWSQQPGGELKTGAPGPVVSTNVAAKPAGPTIPPPDPVPSSETVKRVSNPELSIIPEPAAGEKQDKHDKPVATVPAPGATAGHNGRAEDYSWLCGEVHRVQTSRLVKGWRLRYTRVDEEDNYGGSVLLVSEGHHLDSLQEGQRIRVTGRLLNPECHAAGTPFEVESLSVLVK